MDLKHNTITLGELLDDSRASAVFYRRFGQLLRHPMAGAARSLTLAQLMDMAAHHLPENAIRDTLEELKRL